MTKTSVAKRIPIEPKDLLLPLIGALWACATLVLSLTLELNKLRDKILVGSDGGCVLGPEHRLLMIESDWIPLGWLVVGLCFAFGAMACAMLFLMSKEDRSHLAIRAVVLIVVLVSFSSGVAWKITSYRDLAAMRKELTLPALNPAQSH